MPLLFSSEQNWLGGRRVACEMAEPAAARPRPVAATGGQGPATAGESWGGAARAGAGPSALPRARLRGRHYTC